MTIYIAVITNRQGEAMLTCHKTREAAHNAIKEYFSHLTGKYMETGYKNDYEFAYMGDTWMGNVYARVLMGAE